MRIRHSGIFWESVLPQILSLLLFIGSLSYLKAELPPLLMQEIQQQSAATRGMESLQPWAYWDPDVKNTVILLHGLFEDPRSMEKVALEFKVKGYNVYVPLLPGHGFAFEGGEKITKDVLKTFLDQQIKVLGSLGQKVSLLGFSIGGVMTWNHVVTRLSKNEEVPYVRQSIQLSGAFDETDKVKKKGTIYKNGAILQLRNKFDVDPDIADQRGPEIAQAFTTAMNELRTEIDRAGVVVIPKDMGVSFVINPNDNVADFAADQRVHSRVQGENIRFVVNTESVRHINVPRTPSMLELLGTQISSCKAVLSNQN